VKKVIHVREVSDLPEPKETIMIKDDKRLWKRILFKILMRTPPHTKKKCMAIKLEDDTRYILHKCISTPYQIIVGNNVNICGEIKK
jgi:hypothetical protein